MKYFISILIIILLVCCRDFLHSNKNEGPIKTLKIDVQNSECFKFSDFLNSPEFVTLETTNYDVFSKISQLIVTDSNIIVVPWNPEFTIFIFDRTGKFINSINKIGRGPDEYLGFYFIDVNEEKKLITIFDLGSKKFITMDYKGNFLREIPVNSFYTNKFLVLNEVDQIVADLSNCAIYNSNHEQQYYHLLIYDIGTGRIKLFLPILISDRLLSPNSLYRYKNQIFYNPPLLDTIYQVEKDTVVPKYYLDFGANAKPAGMFTTTDKLKYREIKSRKGMITCHFIFKEIDRYIISAHSSIGNKLYFHMYDKQRDISKVFNRKINDYIGENAEKEMYFKDLPVLITDDFIIFLHEPGEILNNLNSLKETLPDDKYSLYLKNHPAISGLISSIKETDNPILGFYKIK